VPRRIKGKVPKELAFHTKLQLAADMLRTLHDEGILTFKYPVGD
jgi:hypothetical protein